MRAKEPDLYWRKSSASGTSGCVEVAQDCDVVYVRDSKDSSGTKLNFRTEDWGRFVAWLKSDFAALGKPQNRC